MENPLVSLIVASYNNGQYISECLDSLLAQTYRNLEIIIIEDASKDDSVQIIRDYQKTDSRIKLYVNSKNKGVGYTKNRGMQMASGVYGGFVDPDDVIDLKAVEILTDAFTSELELSVVYSQYYICDSSLTPLKVDETNRRIPASESYLTYSCYHPYSIGPFAMFPLKDIKKIGLNTSFPKAIDQDLYLKLDEIGKPLFIARPLYYYRHHENSISLNRNGWLAKLWELHAKRDAYSRRLNTNIPNLTKEELFNEYYYTFKELSLQLLYEKKYTDYVKTLWTFTLVFKSPLKTVHFCYYTLKKHFRPGYFGSQDTHGNYR